jgi:hypothetical protein
MSVLPPRHRDTHATRRGFSWISGIRSASRGTGNASINGRMAQPDVRVVPEDEAGYPTPA